MKEPIRYIFILMAAWCMPVLLSAQADSLLVLSDTLPALAPRDSRIIVLSDSLHRAAGAELGITSEEAGHSENAENSEITDTTKTPKASSRRELRKQKLATFTPDPGKATWAGIVFPGGGQIYNHKYWKLPIVYGGFLGCAYALNWNNQMYSDYSQAYLDIMDDDPNTKSYEDFLPLNSSITGQEERFKEIFKKRKDAYRRQRDLSIFCFIGVYILSIIDAYVDAELSDFDITKDLGLKVEPTIFNDGKSKNINSVGLQCSLKF